MVIVALKIASADDYADTREAVLAKYLSYEDASEVTYQDYLSGTGKTYVSDAAETLTVKASDYAETDMEGLTESDGILWTQGKGSLTYEFPVEEAGLYHVQLTYYPDVNGTQAILRNLYVNGELPFDGCEDIVINRLWVDDNKNWLMNTKGNQAAPTQVQKEGPAVAFLSSESTGASGSYMFYFDKGKNTDA